MTLHVLRQNTTNYVLLLIYWFISFMYLPLDFNYPVSNNYFNLASSQYLSWISAHFNFYCVSVRRKQMFSLISVQKMNYYNYYPLCSA